MKITAEQLREKEACESQVDIFEIEWPDGVEITLQALEKAIILDLDLNWFAINFLTAPALKAYEEVTASAWKAFKEAKAPDLKAYKETTAPALWQVLVN